MFITGQRAQPEIEVCGTLLELTAALLELAPQLIRGLRLLGQRGGTLLQLGGRAAALLLVLFDGFLKGLLALPDGLGELALAARQGLLMFEIAARDGVLVFLIAPGDGLAVFFFALCDDLLVLALLAFEPLGLFAPAALGGFGLVALSLLDGAAVFRLAATQGLALASQFGLGLALVGEARVQRCGGRIAGDLLAGELALLGVDGLVLRIKGGLQLVELTALSADFVACQPDAPLELLLADANDVDAALQAAAGLRLGIVVSCALRGPGFGRLRQGLLAALELLGAGADATFELLQSGLTGGKLERLRIELTAAQVDALAGLFELAPRFFDLRAGGANRLLLERLLPYGQVAFAALQRLLPSGDVGEPDLDLLDDGAGAGSGAERIRRIASRGRARG
jgi:hypothetical protein